MSWRHVRKPSGVTSHDAPLGVFAYAHIAGLVDFDQALAPPFFEFPALRRGRALHRMTSVTIARELRQISSDTPSSGQHCVKLAER